MGKIKILGEKLIDKIAAGEMVERPASVVKELVENSIDAQAASIEVAISDGGKRLIKVSDDGLGMDKDDLLLAFDRHATSKIFSEKDLFALRTMGFRGEALPSIASVSSMQLRSGTNLKTPGNEVVIQGGIISKVNQVAPLKGTIASVHSLFFNTPARRKFLKKEKTEYSHIITWIQNSALSFFQKRFQFSADDKMVLQLFAAQSRLERISQVFGGPIAKSLNAFQDEREGFSIEGYISKPGEHRKDRSGQRFFVNGRFIRDRLLSHFTWSAYREFFPSGHPLIFLFIRIDPSLIDVNVHPAKMEIRFLRPQSIQDSLQQAIRRCFEKASDIPTMTTIPPDPEQKSLMVDQLLPTRENQKDEHFPPSPSFTLSESGVDRFQIIGQYNDTFIIAAEKEDLIIVDQHIAHERVLFERIKDQMHKGGIQKQRLIFPISLECSPSEFAWLEINRDALQRIGIHYEPFGKNTFKVEEIPSILPIDSVVQMMKDMASEDAASPSPSVPESSRYIASLACHAAVKAGAKLDHARMEYILTSLFQCSNPYYCPHGRPIVMKMKSSEIRKKFQRDT